MIEAVERLQDDAAEDSEDIRFSYSRPEQPMWFRAVVRAIERLSGQKKLERLYRRWSAERPAGENIFAGGVRLLGITIETDGADWSRVPACGPVLFVANHPFGVVDGLMLGHLATAIRPDTKVMTHSLLCQPPEARDLLLPVDFGNTAAAQATSILTRRRTLDWLAAGHAVAMFPAGSVSTAQKPLSGPALETPWYPFTERLARVPGLTIVPLYFHGQNSRLFQLMSHTHYALRIALLFRETARRMGQRLRVTVGEPFAASELPRTGDRSKALVELRRRLLCLAGAEGPDPALEFRWPSHISFN